jgi:signal transduction histidine kinase
LSPADRHIDVSPKRQGRQITLSIADNGPGIALESQRRIFDRFTRLDPSPSRTRGGSGLGLPIAQAIARCHPTEIKVHSKPGEGSRSSFDLQLVQRIERQEQVLDAEAATTVAQSWMEG